MSVDRPKRAHLSVNPETWIDLDKPNRATVDGYSDTNGGTMTETAITDCIDCGWRNPWADSGDRGRARDAHAAECPERPAPVPLARLQESNPARWGQPGTMIGHSTRNNLDDTCEVRIEGIADFGDREIVLFAMGAAAKHNAGIGIHSGKIVGYTDDHGRPLPASECSSTALGAVVVCELDMP